MALKCLWRPKLFRYSDKLITEIFPKILESNSPYVHSLALDSIKYWKVSKLQEFNKLAELLLGRLPDLAPEYQLSLFKYGILSQETRFVEALLPHWDNFSFILSSKDITKLVTSLRGDEKSEQMKKFLESIKEDQRNKDLRRYLGVENLSNAEISLDSDIMTVTTGDRTTLYYGLSQTEPQFSVLLDLIEKFKLKNFILPIQSKSTDLTRKEVQALLEEKLKDTDNYKTLDIHKMVYTNKMGVKSLNVPWSLVYKKPECKFFAYMPEVNVIKTMTDDFFEVEKNTRLCMVIDGCRVLDEVSEYGCYLCTKHRVGYDTYQDYAMFSSLFYQDFLSACSQNIGKVNKVTLGNNLVLVPKSMMVGLAKAVACEQKYKPAHKVLLSDENDMLAKVFFDREV